VSFHVQPDRVRFFEVLSVGLEQGPWTDFAIAVAWARENAVASMTPVLSQFLQAGGRFKITVGIELLGTSREALESLLALERYGFAETFIYHNEAPEETFHPKIYLLSGRGRARLIVGSSNLTGGGLATNVEAALELESPVDGPAIVEAVRCLAGLRDLQDPRVKRLDAAFLAELVASGYVISEAEIRTRRATQTRARAANARPRNRLFGTVRRARLPGARRPQVQVVEAAVLLLRPRRASATARRTQVQVPIRLTRTPFFTGVASVVSAHDNRRHGLRRARARGGLNTVKLELPETDAIENFVLRLTKRGDRVTYEAFSTDSELGRPIADALQAGLETDPPTTTATIPNLDRATLYRFV